MLTKFLTLTNSYFNYIDTGEIFRKPYRWLYMVIAILNLLIPIGLLITAFKNDLFSNAFSVVVAFLFAWLFVLIAGAVSCMLWWNRKEKLKSIFNPDDEFVVTPIFSNYIQTFGENLATWIAIGGIGVSIASLLLGDEGGYAMRSLIPFDTGKVGFFGIVIFPVMGFVILVFFRFIAEQLKALAAIANNTRKAKADLFNQAA